MRFFRHKPLRQGTWVTTTLIASALLAILISVGCRGGGANPGDDDLVIPFVEPTQSDRTCANDIYPADAPQLTDVADNDFRPGSNGVDYAIIEQGEGEQPGTDWQISVHYTGWLEDGCIFGTTYNGERPARFFLNFVIPGWRQSLLDMNIGERRRIRIPPEQAYGAAGSPPRIPANATLTFDVLLVEGVSGEDAMLTATAVNEAAAATITAVSEEVESTFAAIEETATAEAELGEEADGEESSADEQDEDSETDEE